MADEHRHALARIRHACSLGLPIDPNLRAWWQRGFEHSATDQAPSAYGLQMVARPRRAQRDAAAVPSSPKPPVHQWVLSLPIPLRLLLPTLLLILGTSILFGYMT